MKTVFTLLTAIVLLINNAVGQTNTFPSTGAVGIGTTIPNSSSLLEINSTTKGLLIPRMTLTQRNAIVTTAKGLMIFQTNSTPGFYYYSGTAWTAVTAKNFWGLKGNAGTVAGTNFIGTTDAQNLVFKVNNTWAGFIDNSTYNAGTRNTAFGLRTLYSNTTGIENTAIGYGTLYSNLDGNNNSAFGKYALFTNSSGSYNTALGYNSLYANTNGSNNTATGRAALQSNTTGNENTANGGSALYANQGGSDNTATGFAALNANSSGNYNTASGGYALYSNTNGSDNTAHGYGALQLNSTGNFNTATGFNALYANTGSFNTATGDLSLANNTTGTYNTATGVNALRKNLTGSRNTAYGNNTLYTIEGGSDNTAIGYNAMYGDNSSGGGVINKSTAIGSYAMFNASTVSGLPEPGASLNTAVGFSALYSGTYVQENTAIGDYALYSNDDWWNTAVGAYALYLNTGQFNTAVGDQADVSSNQNSATVIGASAFATASKQVRIGSIGDNFADPTSIGGKVGWSTLSDGRVKKNIKENVPGLIFINKLKPITYNVDNDAVNKIVQRPAVKDRKENYIKPSADEISAGKPTAAIIYTGFVAQEVEKAAKSLNYDFSGVDAAKNDKDLYGLRYADFVVPLVKAVQELSAKNDDLQTQVNELKALILSGNSNNTSSAQNITNTLLEQNVPNPFSHTTTINYSLPQKYTNAQITITDKTGKTLKAVTISGSGKGSLNIDASTLASGAYQYSLYIDGKLMATKQMVLAK